MRIALDVMGGDGGPAVVIEGIKKALQSPGNERIEQLLLAGRGEEIAGLLEQYGVRDSRVQIHPATEVLTMEDHPLHGIRKKRDCSLMRAVDLVRDGKAEAVISLGNTGGLVTAAMLRLRPVEGVHRPAIGVMIPHLRGQFLLIDAGANPEADARHLVHNAIMGSVYYHALLDCEKPRIGVISNGSEDHKGTELTQEAVRLCRKLGLNCAGYVEGPDLFEGRVEIAVTDGFTGNIILKTIEGMGKAIQTMLKTELTATPMRKLGIAMAGGLRDFKRRMNPDSYGGARILGLNGVVIKVHGSAKAAVVANALLQAAESYTTRLHHLNSAIQKEVQEANEKMGLAKPGQVEAVVKH